MYASVSRCRAVHSHIRAAVDARVADPTSGECQIHPGDSDEFAWHAADNPLPEAVDVAIVGGGIIGSSTACFLAQQGVSAAVVERGRVGGGQAGGQGGWV